MAKVCLWDGEKIHTFYEPLSTYLVSLRTSLDLLHEQMLKQNYPVIDVANAIDFLIDNEHEFIVVLGDSFICVTTEQEEWHSPGKVLCEEFFGPRIKGTTVDLDDLLGGMKAAAVSCGCIEFLMGTLANPRKEAMAKLLKFKGMEVKTITLRYKV